MTSQPMVENVQNFLRHREGDEAINNQRATNARYYISGIRPWVATFMSYDTPIAQYDSRKNEVLLDDGFYSHTTRRTQNAIKKYADARGISVVIVDKVEG